MSKAYSNKALPVGTIVREWRLEDVLGVGGFGIVYKAKGIYFGELVAIKEYFPSSISERDAEATVVPIGSDVEEVHALGLKKFVEEAKLLWNLSTPSRHPNIVSVRSLFQIHGTAYMVMDFEDGDSLSKLLREGRRFNERSLWNIIQPIAEGLDRAHRVGVLHRDIKPPNILITEDNRPVLIDFGSARFEAAEATSTSVTFHTPPYAAIEQYVKTYPQGPWTDVYALAVVLYECVTGEKPPEVLERLHGEQGKPLSDGHWPGFSKKFLQAIDAGMTIKPTERPQSIRDWLDMFGKKEAAVTVDPADEPTRFFAEEVASETIVPVADPAPGFDPVSMPESQVPADPSEAEFKRAGQDTGASRRKKALAAASVAAKGAPSTVDPAAAAAADSEPEPAAKAESAAQPETAPKKAAVDAGKARDGAPSWIKTKQGQMVAGGAAVVLAAVTGAMLMSGGDSQGGTESSIPSLIDFGSSSVDAAAIEGMVGGLRTLVNDARTAGVPAGAIDPLDAATNQLAQQVPGLKALLAKPEEANAAQTQAEQMNQLATSANLAFAAALLRDADARAQRISGASPEAGTMRAVLAELRASVEGSAGAADPTVSLAAARDALAKFQAFAPTFAAAARATPAIKKPAEVVERTVTKLPTTVAPTTTTVATTTAPVVTTTTTVPSSAGSVSSSKKAQIQSAVSSGRSMARQVISIGRASDATPQQKANVKLAQGYDSYLAKVQDSARGVKSDREADQLIKQANQTKAYITFLLKQSQAR